jgi:3-phenylpropionate/cinnamic acid dioxygenase small subunit
MTHSTRDGVMETMSRYVHAVDDRDFDALRQVFADDVRYEMGGTFEGAEAAVQMLRDRLREAPRSRHVISSVSVTEQGSDEATALSDWVLIVQIGDGWTVGGAGRYKDRLRRDGEAWVFTERLVSMAGA